MFEVNKAVCQKSELVRFHEAHEVSMSVMSKYNEQVSTITPLSGGSSDLSRFDHL